MTSWKGRECILHNQWSWAIYITPRRLQRTVHSTKKREKGIALVVEVLDLETDYILKGIIDLLDPDLEQRQRQTNTTRLMAKTKNEMLVYSPKPAPSSKSPEMSPSSAVASWYCWYSEMRSFKFDSASVNSISSIPSPVYQ